MQYMIATRDSIHDLETCVQELIDAGWRPLGGVSVSESQLVTGSMRDGDGSFGSSSQIFCAQAMVKGPDNGS